MMSAPASPPPPFAFDSDVMRAVDKYMRDQQDIVRKQAERIAELEHALSQKPKWAAGCRGDGVSKAPGFTSTETTILRILAASGRVTKEQLPNGNALYRHISNIRRKLPKSVKIRTDIGLGYDLDSGQDILRRLVEGKPIESDKPKRKTVRPMLNLTQAAA